MASIQVIDRQQDPLINLITDTGKTIADTMRQKQALKIEAYKAKILAQQTDNEAKKLEYENYGKFLDHAVKFKDMGVTDLTPLQEIYGNDTIPFTQKMGKVLTSLKDAKGSAQDQKTAEETKILQDPGPYMQKMTQGIQSMQEGLDPTAGGVAPDGATRGGMLMKGGNVNIPGGGSMSFENPRTAEILARNDVRAREEEKRAVALEPTQKRTDNLLNVFSAGVKEMDGLGESALSAKAKGSAKLVESEFGKLPAIQAYGKIKEQSALELASYFNQGRPSDPDKTAILKALPEFTYPQATNDILIQSLKDSLKMGDYSVDKINLLKNQVIDPTKKFVAEALKSGKSQEEIDYFLREYYKSIGY